MLKEEGDKTGQGKEISKDVQDIPMSISQSVGCPLSRRGVRLARWLQLAEKGTALSPEQSAQQLGDTCSDLVRGIWMDCERN